MKDIGLFLDNEVIDIKLEDGDLAGDEGLETAILISLFTDQRIRDDEIPQGEISKRGWWGDMSSPIEGDQIGSKLWLYDREKITDTVLAQMETRCLASLQWLIDDGVATNVEVTVTRDEFNINKVNIVVNVTRPTGAKDKFSFFWDKQEQKAG